ncbi:MAG: glycosyltransferase, partial [Candidatus Promineofilum sp.]|nr:glycosyltransferase [Promineifilum sp.]
ELAQLPATLAAAEVGLYLMDDTLLNRTKCPVKLADMLAAGVPVVAEAVGQVTEYVRDGRTGALRATGDVAGLVAAAVALLNNSPERTRMGTAARADVGERFSWERLATIAEKAYAG